MSKIFFVYSIHPLPVQADEEAAGRESEIPKQMAL
jgi:hypothetical protein